MAQWRLPLGRDLVNDDMYGEADDDELRGGDGSDDLDGGDGDDLLRGGAGTVCRAPSTR